ncbi:type II toxin-antitoxin system Phd/YefM family antitoxin [Agromyces humi]|jgi:prevent-host-death family protein|uniref:type II toxin-antitoxin system Phd/YefM family antitoxin n=1 Tax=Agromyces humi TaxID=1766800 RepID=UPI001357F49C|nr:type II toxin-antitoxin system Phd/YefM family antitoxin [Agromyces humi]
MQTVSVTEARQTFALLVDAIEQGNDPVVITRRGDAAVVLMSFEMFEELRSSHRADP